MRKVVVFVGCNFPHFAVIFKVLENLLTGLKVSLSIFDLTFFELYFSSLSELNSFFKHFVFTKQGQSFINGLISSKVVFFLKTDFSIFRMNAKDLQTFFSIIKVDLISKKFECTIGILFCLIDLATLFLNVC